MVKDDYCFSRPRPYTYSPGRRQFATRVIGFRRRRFGNRWAANARAHWICNGRWKTLCALEWQPSGEWQPSRTPATAIYYSPPYHQPYLGWLISDRVCDVLPGGPTQIDKDFLPRSTTPPSVTTSIHSGNSPTHPLLLQTTYISELCTNDVKISARNWPDMIYIYIYIYRRRISFRRHFVVIAVCSYTYEYNVYITYIYMLREMSHGTLPNYTPSHCHPFSSPYANYIRHDCGSGFQAFYYRCPEKQGVNIY